MDWCIPTNTTAAKHLRHEFARYIKRHAAEDSDLQAAELIFGELINNAIDNSEGSVWVSLTWSARRPVLSINDLGAGFEMPTTSDEMPGPDSLRGRGLMIVTHLTDQLEVAAKAAGGSRVRVTLPVVRPPTENIDPPSLPADHLLPTPDEIGSDGRYGRESFLRALVVQTAQTIELESGPRVAERVVASVGTGVGLRMEEAFRASGELSDGPLSADQMAQAFLDLKGGIGGDFFVIESDEERIVLGNRRCPFGDVVKSAPALCRMTSSVFGGIAARNASGSAVHLEERIAVGDPECRVTVWLKQPPADIESDVHFYGQMHSTDG